MINQSIIPYSREYYIVLGITIILLVVKVFLIVYLTKKVLDKKKEGEKIGLNFTTGVLFLIIIFFISRLLYVLFDFVLTKFDPDLYTYPPNIYVWKIASFILCLGPLPLLFFIDKNVFKFKLKKIPELIVIAGALIMLLYPVEPGSNEDFQFVSSVGFIAGVGLFLIPIAFLIIILKTTGDIRKNAILVVLSLGIYVVGAIPINEGVLQIIISLYGTEMRVVMHFFTTILKSTGLILFSYAATRFHL